MKLARSRLAVSLVLLLGVWSSSSGCLEDDGSSMATGGSGMAGADASGGRMNAGGGGAAGAGPSAGSGGGSAADPTAPLLEAQCGGIRSNMACPLAGTCADRPCGLADLGRRDCVCDGTWSCTSCAFPMGSDQPSVLSPPTPGGADAGDAGDAGGGIRSCEAGVADEVPCAPMGDRCLTASEVCACWLMDDDGQNIWDCDDPPSFWP